jgi:hypothetical protein
MTSNHRLKMPKLPTPYSLHASKSHSDLTCKSKRQNTKKKSSKIQSTYSSKSALKNKPSTPILKLTHQPVSSASYSIAAWPSQLSPPAHPPLNSAPKSADQCSPHNLVAPHRPYAGSHPKKTCDAPRSHSRFAQARVACAAGRLERGP